MYKREGGGGDEQRETETGTDRQTDRDRETKPEVKKDMRILTTTQPWRLYLGGNENINKMEKGQ